MQLNKMFAFGSEHALLKNTVHELLLTCKEFYCCTGTGDKSGIQNVIETMTVCSCLEVTIPLFPTAVIFELVLVTGTTFDATLERLQFSVLKG